MQRSGKKRKRKKVTRMNNETFLKVMDILAKMQYEIEKLEARIILSTKQMEETEKAMQEVIRRLEYVDTYPKRYLNDDGSITLVPMDDGSVAVDIERKEE